MANFEVVNVLGKKVSTLELADSVFNIEPHNQAMFDLILAERASFRQGTHATKNRSEVSGGGRKPWKQKGTGRARQGSIRSPQWRGGGVVFGPRREKNYQLKINKKIKKLALRSGWSQLAKENKLIIVDNIDFKTPSTKDFLIMLKNFEINNKKIILLLDDHEISNYNTYLSARNIKNVLITHPHNTFLNTLLSTEYVILTGQSAKIIEESYK